jgi:hypothetical protein
METKMPRLRVPRFIQVLFIINLTLALAYVLDYLVGRPYRPLTQFLDLNGECNLPTWYSSVQWFAVAALLGLFAKRNASRASPRSWLLFALPIVFLAFSLDEVAQIHEAVGKRSDALFIGDRAQSMFSRTGIWMFVVGMPFAAFFIALVLLIRDFFRHARAALVTALIGVAILLLGAVGIEVLRNWVMPGSAYDILQAFLEELCEMTGGTVVLWGSYELLVAQRAAVRFGSGPGTPL